MNQGVDFDVAFTLDDISVAAWCILFSVMNGSKFNWNTMRFEDPK